MQSVEIAELSGMTRKLCIAPLIASLFVLAQACETVPEVVEMTPASFSQVFERNQSEANPARAEQQWGELLNGSLSPTQRHETLYARAMSRWNNDYNKPGAMSDLLTLVEAELPGRHTSAAATGINILGQEITEHRGRLAGLQSQSDWFADKVALGDIDEVASRFQASGLTPTQAQTDLFVAAGFICSGAASDVQPIHAFDDRRPHTDGLYWCPAAPIT